MLSWLHRFVSPKADGTDSTLIKPSNWNDGHDFKSTIDGFVLGIPAGAGAGPIQEILMATLLNVVIPAGVMWSYAGSAASVPAGWYLCYGQLLNRVTDARLFAAIGTTYSAGDGSTTFGLPDRRGVGSVGKSDMGGVDRGNLTGGAVLGAYLGVQNNTAFTTTNSSGNNNINFGNLPFVQTSGQISTASLTNVSTAGGSTAAAYLDQVSIGGYVTVNYNTLITVAGNATSSAFSIVQPSMVQNIIIKR
jgi:microcystin-dependent protein